MKMRKLGCCALALGLAVVVNQAAWAQNQRPSQRTLDAMGLGGLAVMSDEEAMSVRGHGFMGGSSAAVFGNSFATFTSPLGTSHSENGYAAEGNKFAFGKNFSEAGLEVRVTHGKKGGRHGGGMNGGKVWRPKHGGNMGGHPGGGRHGGKTSSFSVRVFAGGFSSAFAH